MNPLALAFLCIDQGQGRREVGREGARRCGKPRARIVARAAAFVSSQSSISELEY